MDRARIYVDLDDVLAQTVRGLLDLLERHTGRRLAEEEVASFDLAQAFGLAPRDFEAFMRLAHRPEELAALAPTPGAAAALGAWQARGYGVFVMTGRPPSSEEASKRWLEAQGMPHSSLACVDKYARPDWGGAGRRPLPLDALAQLDFQLAVEDSLAMAAFLVERCGVPVALLDRPWNRDLRGLAPATAARIARCRDWEELLERFATP
jgi:uncharacterized HAD superfamily protein